MSIDQDNFLIRFPLLSSISIVILYFLSLISSAIILGLIASLMGITTISTEMRIVAGVIETLTNFVVLGFVYFYLVPIVFQFPKRANSIKDGLINIRVMPINPIQPHLMLAIMITLPIMIYALILAIVTCNWEFTSAAQQILPPDSYVLITAVIPGVFEEVAFRGFICRILGQKFSRNNTIIISSILFGSVHYFNLLNGSDFIITTGQVGYSVFIGILLAYVYFETGSLIPGIIIHYFIAGIGQFAVYGIFALDINPYVKVLYLTIGLGLVPSMMGMQIIKIWKRARKYKQS